MQRAKPAKIGPAEVFKIEEVRPGELGGNDDADKQPGNAPEHRSGDAELDQRVFVFGLVERVAPIEFAGPQANPDKPGGHSGEEERRMDTHQAIRGIRGD